MGRIPRYLEAIEVLRETAYRTHSTAQFLAEKRQGPNESPHFVGAAGEPGFGSTWASAPGFPPVSFYRGTDGFVHLRGRARSTRAGGTTAPPIFYLPDGFRPVESERPMVMAIYYVFEIETRQAQMIRIRASDGEVLPESNAFEVRLDQVRFRTVV